MSEEKKFEDFARRMKNIANGKRCLLLAKKGKAFYFTVSGTNIKNAKDKKEYEEFSSEMRNKTEEAILDLGLTKKDKFEIVTVPVTDSILFKDEQYGAESGPSIRYITYQSPLNHVVRGKAFDFSCVERKLLAYFGNSKTALAECEYLICRYIPCWRCAWVAMGLPNFFCFGYKKPFRLVMTEGMPLICHQLSMGDGALVALNDATVFGDENPFGVGPNYTFIKDFI